jgi:hypothetical protein
VADATTGRLFVLGLRLDPAETARERAVSLTSQLAGACPPDARHGPLEELAAAGAVAVLDRHREPARAPIRPTKFVARAADGAPGAARRA